MDDFTQIKSLSDFSFFFPHGKKTPEQFEECFEMQNAHSQRK
jgi:hypothetical protein